MPIYEYRCATCDESFELRRPVGESQSAATCSSGHPARRVLSVFATVGGGAPEAAAPMASGGCGANCACAAGF